jgi:D-serine deaminase-like pyridoxal phosphate-dependent protein
LSEHLTGLIGHDRNAIPTPSLVLDRAALDANIAALAAWADGNVSLRPHAKTHKCVEIARRQIEHGAIGVTTATVAEARAMLSADPNEILIANEVVAGDKIAAAVAIARECRLLIAVDDPSNAGDLSSAAERAGVVIDVLVDVDVGLHRCGVRTMPQARDLARAIAGLGGLRLRGVMGFEGQAMLIPDRAERAGVAAGAMDFLAECVAQLRADGHTVDIVSAGGTTTHDMTGVHPVVTELQAGTYATMDYGYHPLAGRFQPTLYVAATVVSRSDDTAVLDAGTKTIALEVLQPTLAPGLGTIREVHEEHTLVDPEPGQLALGAHVELRVGYAGGTVNLHDAYVVVEDDVVTDIWSICARGSGIGL